VKWDEEVDVVCTGSGVACVATAIGVVDLGGEVFVANATCSPSPHPRLGVDVEDAETNEYLAALSADLAPLNRSRWDVDVPIRMVHQLVPVDAGRTVAPFIGSRLRDWAARCIASPYGYLYTRVFDGQADTLHTSAGESLEVREIGSMTPDANDVPRSVTDWLTAQAGDRRLETHSASSLQRIVFEEGDPVGAVFTTPDGPVAIRTRLGVIVASGGPQVTAAVRQQLLIGDAAVRVCLVSQRASRFGRVELLTSEAVAGGVAPTACRPKNRRLQANLRQTQTHSHAWRCGKGDGYPPFGE
jgi:hypothetical protein